ncbi:MAG: helix-turn-helix-type transcriptional regulator [Gammaproteobacteria bacterium HGW-Gammaproteobacteria-11]|nr:MAG: helix-turn-helix-type transcriptional regulator [Gammaproteobacteria bacterium HGW-Gammaproteobacteria-11]
MTENIESTAVVTAQDLNREDLFPIREVSRLTGVNPVTLRAWERRYGLLVPHRTPSGHRLYSMHDINRVKAVMSWIERGVAVSKVASIIDRQVLPPVQQVSTNSVEGPAGNTFALWQSKLIEAVNNFDTHELDRLYGQLHASFPLSVVFQDIILPVWNEFHNATEPKARSGQWRFLDAFLRGRLFQRTGFLKTGQPNVVLVGLHEGVAEIELLLAALFINAAGADVTLVPALASISELSVVAERSECAVLVLYGAVALGNDLLLKHLPRLEQQLDCPVAVVGPLCEVQPEALTKAGLHLVGLADDGLTLSIRSLLAGHLDS